MSTTLFASPVLNDTPEHPPPLVLDVVAADAILKVVQTLTVEVVKDQRNCVRPKDPKLLVKLAAAQTTTDLVTLLSCSFPNASLVIIVTPSHIKGPQAHCRKHSLPL